MIAQIPRVLSGVNPAVVFSTNIKPSSFCRK